VPVHDHRFQSFRSSLKAYGVGAGLAQLNHGVPHRFSGIFELDAGNLRCVHLFDKQGVYVATQMERCLMTDGFCGGAMVSQIGGASGGFPGATHYHAVPLLSPTEELIGTLCHFDAVSHELGAGEFLTLQRAARLLPSFLRFPSRITTGDKPSG